MDTVRTLETGRRVLAVRNVLFGGGFISIASLCSSLGVKKRSAQRYIEFAREHWNLVSYKHGNQVRWVLAHTPTKTDLDRAAALGFATLALADLEGSRYHDHLVEAAEAARGKLLGTVAPLERVAASFVAVRPERSSNAEYSRSIEILLDAIRDRRAVAFDYCRLDSHRARYEVEPWTLTFHRGRAALVGGKRNVPGRRWPPRRTFEIDRVTELRVIVGSKFEPPTPKRFRADSFLADSFGIYSDADKQPETVVLQVKGAPAVLLRNRKVHHSQVLLEDAGDRYIRVQLTVCVCPELRAWLLGLLPHVEVIAPAQLADEVQGACRVFLEDAGWTATPPKRDP